MSCVRQYVVTVEVELEWYLMICAAPDLVRFDEVAARRFEVLAHAYRVLVLLIVLRAQGHWGPEVLGELIRAVLGRQLSECVVVHQAWASQKVVFLRIKH